MEDFREKLSVLSAFLKKKIKDKGISVKEVAVKSGLSKRYIYELISEKRDSIPTNEALNKIATGLEMTEEDRKYILELAERERDSGEMIYPSELSPHPEPHPEEPSPSSGEPQPDGGVSEPGGSLPGHDVPEYPSVPQGGNHEDNPSLPATVPSSDVQPWYKRREFAVAFMVVCIGAILFSCCGFSSLWNLLGGGF